MSQYSFDAPDADIILRSSQLEAEPSTFRVHKQRLAEASAVFRDMFSLPQPPNETDSSLPIVDLSEASSILDAFLRFVYPCDDPDISSLSRLVAVMEAAAKYQTEVIMYRLSAVLRSKRFLKAEPFRVYAISIRFGFQEEARIASTAALSVALSEVPCFDDLAQISGFDYHRLVIFHANRSKEALKIVESHRHDPRLYTYEIYQKWEKLFKEKAKDELAARPTSEVIFSFPFLASIMQLSEGKCDKGRPCGVAPTEFFEFLDKLKKKLETLPDTI